jgi:hypothetical protein
MKCYYRLECDNLSEIQSQTLDYLKSKTNLLEVKPSEPWNTTDTRDFIKNCPALIEWCKGLRLLPHEVSFIVSHDSNSGLPIHTDQGPLIAKINVPIQNTTGNITRWHADDDSVIAETGMDTPVVFNSSIPHSVEIHSKHTPRIVMAVMIKNENSLLEYLKK